MSYLKQMAAMIAILSVALYSTKKWLIPFAPELTLDRILTTPWHRLLLLLEVVGILVFFATFILQELRGPPDQNITVIDLYERPSRFKELIAVLLFFLLLFGSFAGVLAIVAVARYFDLLERL